MESGWADSSVRLTLEEMDRVTGLMRESKEGKVGHFHMASCHDEEFRGSDIEFSIVGSGEKGNLDVLGGPIASDD